MTVERNYVRGLRGLTVELPAVVCARLAELPEVIALQRQSPHGSELREVLTAVQVIGSDWIVNGSRARNPRKLAQAVDDGDVTAAQAAELKGVTASAIRLAISEGRLRAKQTRSGWVIAVGDLNDYNPRGAT